jgi:hypothetical protein
MPRVCHPTLLNSDIRLTVLLVSVLVVVCFTFCFFFLPRQKMITLNEQKREKKNKRKGRRIT